MRPYVGLSSGVSLCIVLLVVLLLCCWTGWLDIMLSDGMLVEGSSTSPHANSSGPAPRARTAQPQPWARGEEDHRHCDKDVWPGQGIGCLASIPGGLDDYHETGASPAPRAD